MQCFLCPLIYGPITTCLVPWKPSKCVSLQIVYIEITVPDAFWNSWSMCDINLVQFFRISFNNTHYSLSVSFFGLPDWSTFQQSPLTFHFLLAKATVYLGMLNSLDMSFKDWPFLWYPTILPFWKSDSCEFRCILNRTNAGVSSYTIIKYRKCDVDQDHIYTLCMGVQILIGW